MADKIEPDELICCVLDTKTKEVTGNYEEFVVLTSGTKTLVIGMNDVEDTQAIYDTMLEKIGE